MALELNISINFPPFSTTQVIASKSQGKAKKTQSAFLHFHILLASHCNKTGELIFLFSLPNRRCAIHNILAPDSNNGFQLFNHRGRQRKPSQPSFTSAFPSLNTATKQENSFFSSLLNRWRAIHNILVPDSNNGFQLFTRRAVRNTCNSELFMYTI